MPSERSSASPAPSRVDSCWVRSPTSDCLSPRRPRNRVDRRKPVPTSRADTGMLPASCKWAMTSALLGASISPVRVSPEGVTALYSNSAMTCSGLLSDAQNFFGRRSAGQRLDEAVFVHDAHACAAGLLFSVARRGVTHDPAAYVRAEHEQLVYAGAAPVAGRVFLGGNGPVQAGIPDVSALFQPQLGGHFRQHFVAFRSGRI